MVPPNVMSRRLHYAVLLADLVWILLSLATAYLVREGAKSPAIVGQPSYLEYSIVVALALAVWAFLYGRMRLDGFSDGWDVPRVFSRVLISVLLLMSIMLSTAFLARQLYSRLLLSYFACFLMSGFIGIRCLTRAFIASRSRNQAQSRVVIMGNGHIAREIADKMGRHPELMKKVVGFLYSSNDLPVGSPRSDVPATTTPPTSTLGVVDLLKRQAVDEIVVAHPKASVSEIQKLLRLSRLAGLRVSLVPEGYELYLSKASFLDVEGLPMLCLEEQCHNPLALAVKRITDVTLATFLFLFVSPIVLVGALSVVMSGKKPFRRELRCGQNGKLFSMWRINLDRDSAELSGLRLWVSRLSLTELPQLLNVILGDMSLVGPRPEPAERVKHYSDWQRQRLNAKPGLTGLAQVHGLRDQHSSEDKARFDLQYMLHWSPLLDLSLLLQTLWTVTVRLWSSAEPTAPVPQISERGLMEVPDVDRSHASAN
jgi:lipopolysaccharide/colanic/teichoic acid biosynthesis glycosyltransferase